MRRYSISALLAVLLASATIAADVTNPEEVAGLRLDKSGADVLLQWDAVTLDASGNPETIDFYEVYRGAAATFVPDKTAGSNRIGAPATETLTDTTATGPLYFYLVGAVDTAGNKGLTRASELATPPLLSGFWTDTTIELDWTSAEPIGQVQSYRVYRGQSRGNYEFVEDVALSQTYSAIGLATNVNWHFAVAAVDMAGNESFFSNEHTDPVGGTIMMGVHDENELCWGASGCTPTDPDHVQRSDGFQLLVPADFPEGDWGRVDVTFTMESRLCVPPNGGNVTKCGSGNPCVDPPCNGGYNTCGDPWDRLAHLFLVLDDCVDQGHGCINHDNIELMRAATPFGTDARIPNGGTGVVPPRKLTLDITPFANLLAGQRRHIGAHIGHFVQKGWWVSSDFYFSKRPEDVSPKPPADGVEPVFFHSSSATLTGPFTVDLPPQAQDTIGRIFITGHGGGSAPDCANPADEFCQRINRLWIDSSLAWADTPWRDCCWPRGGDCSGCTAWNACGFPSCTFDRSGWCPGELACHDNLDDGCDQDQLLTPYMSPGASHDFEYEVVNVAGSWSRSLAVYWYQNLTQFCGNDIREGSELCDGPDIGGETCQSQGWDTGTLACDFGCQAFDTSGCRDFVCGNNICELSDGEDCISCPNDCNGIQSGNPGNRFCCGDGDGDTPVDCTDGRCFQFGNTCEP